MANISSIKLPDGITYTLKDNGALQLTGGTVTGAVSFSDAITVTTINGVTVGNSPKFTDTVTTVTTSGSGNAVTSITASNGTLTVTKGSTFLTGITSSQVTTALGYTPYNSTNPNSYASIKLRRW